MPKLRVVVVALLILVFTGSVKAISTFSDTFGFSFFFFPSFTIPTQVVVTTPTIDVPDPDEITRENWLAENPRQAPGRPNFFFGPPDIQGGTEEQIAQTQKALDCLLTNPQRSATWNAQLVEFDAIDVTITIQRGACGGDLACVEVADDPNDAFQSLGDVRRTRSGPVNLLINPDSLKNTVNGLNGAVTPEQVLAEVLIHELGHVFFLDNHDLAGVQLAPQDPRFRSVSPEIAPFITEAYMELFDGLPPPLISIGDGRPTVKIQVPECLGGFPPPNFSSGAFGNILNF